MGLSKEISREKEENYHLYFRIRETKSDGFKKIQIQKDSKDSKL